MTARRSQSSKEEVAQRGQEIYRSQVEPEFEDGNYGRYVATDIETGDYEVADDTMTAVRQLRGRAPDAQVWMVRVGYRAVHRLV